VDIKDTTPLGCRVSVDCCDGSVDRRNDNGVTNRSLFVYETTTNKVRSLYRGPEPEAEVVDNSRRLVGVQTLSRL
jgi:hypothetical protein